MECERDAGSWILSRDAGSWMLSRAQESRESAHPRGEKEDTISFRISDRSGIPPNIPALLNDRPRGDFQAKANALVCESTRKWNDGTKKAL